MKSKEIERKWNNAWNSLLDLLFPRRCPVCDEILLGKADSICEKCQNKLQIITEPYCLRCGKPLRKAEEEFCKDCLKRTHIFKKGRALFTYETIQESLYRFKYAKRAEYGKFYAEQIAKHLGAEIKRWNPDAIVPVPLHRKRYLKRGYNQAEIIALELGRKMNIPVKTNLIKRVKETIPQKELNIAQRQNNLKKAFKIYQNDVKLKTIIIIDDIFTTGSTIDAMAVRLEETKVENVYFVTLAIGNGL